MLVKITVAIAPDAEEAIAEALLEESPSGIGVEEVAEGLLVSAFVPAERVEHIRKLVHAKAIALRTYGLDVGPARVSVEPVDEKEWATVYREHFHVEKIGRVVIRPTWEVYEPSPGEAVIGLDPGLAFGTGSHPTTRGCLIALEKYLQPGWVVLDLGTGSGILAIAAVKLGASRVLALDIDPIAMRVAIDNATANGVADRIEIMEGDVSVVRGTRVDMVLANLTAPDIIEALPSLALLPGVGVMVLSGILESQAKRVKSAVAKNGFAVKEEISENEWVSLVVGIG
ncbi:MAG: 50S ribosomal protein L11 methyltransferase [Chloroflexi bacterium]|nr:50S ribosomal protein L11 methyltransferase [Chloroflexota bacterium]